MIYSGAPKGVRFYSKCNEKALKDFQKGMMCFLSLECGEQIAREYVELGRHVQKVWQ